MTGQVGDYHITNMIATDDRPVCINCECIMACKKNGMVIHRGNGVLHACDVFECPRCGGQVATRFANDMFRSGTERQVLKKNGMLCADLTGE